MDAPDPRRTGSITRSILAKQPRVLLLHPSDEDGLTLSSQLRRIGCAVETCWPPPDDIARDVELVLLFMQPQIEATNYEWLRRNPPPIIAVTSFENPTVIDEALRIGAMGMLNAPVRSSGLLSALVMALSHHRNYTKHAQRVVQLEEKFSSFRIVEEAKALIQSLEGFSEDEAYEILRTQAQERRISIGSVAKELINANKLLTRTIGSGARATRKEPDS